MNENGTTLLPAPTSTFAPEVDSLFYFIFYTSVILFVLVVAGMLFFAWRYRRRKQDGDQVTYGVAHNRTLELVWTIIPTILVMIVFVWGFKIYMKMNIIPRDAIEIKVTGQKWFWVFDYPEGFTTVHELVIPVDQPVKLVMSSEDVIHSFFVPNFRVKMDVLPNRYTTAWFEATEVGTYDLFCAEYCGKGHSEMLGNVRVVTEAEYAEWQETVNTIDESIPLEELGETLFTSRACNTCHSIDGSIIQAPSFLNVFGTTMIHTDGSSVTVDENYLRESILEPQAKVVVGFNPVMPTYQGILKDREIDGLIAYIKSLTD